MVEPGDRQPHVIVVGSGAGGLGGAIGAARAGARVTVLERSPSLGGTTAISGGVVWIPDAAAPDGQPVGDAALTYLSFLIPTAADQRLVESYVQSASRVLREELPAASGLRLVPYSTPDYHPELPGGVEAGRSFGPTDFRPTSDALGPYVGKIRDAPFRMQWINDARADEGWWQAGRALVGTLVAAAHRLGVEFRTDSRVTSLQSAEGMVVGVVGEDSSGSRFAIDADAVLLACGGFEHSQRLSEQHFGFTFDAPMSPPWNEGDGLAMALEVGADVSNLSGAWWTAVFHVDGETQDHSRAFRNTNNARALPGSILVDAKGERFVDEARSYHIVGRAMAQFDPQTATYPHRNAWLIFGRDFLPRYGATAFGDLEIDARWVHVEDSLDALAQRVGIDPDGLVRTVSLWNADMREGSDTAFHRGENFYDRYQGDRDRIDSAEATLAPISDGPYCAVRVHLGVLGTKGGPRVDASGRVLTPRETPIPGLYAAGNVASSVMRAAYPGGGATIGPALTFGFIAGEHAASLRPVDSLRSSRAVVL